MILNLIINLESARFHHHALIALGLTFLTLHTPCKKEENRVRLGHQLRCSNLLVVECPYVDTSFCKLEAHSIFAILVRNVFTTQSKIYDGTFLQISESLSAVNFFAKYSIIDVQVGSKYFSE